MLLCVGGGLMSAPKVLNGSLPEWLSSKKKVLPAKPSVEEK